MDVRSELVHALDRIQEPPAQPSHELLAVAARSAQLRRRHRSGLGLAAIVAVAGLAAGVSTQEWFSDNSTTDSNLVGVASPGELPTGELPADLLPMLRRCGAIIDPKDDRVYLADGAEVLRRVDGVVDPGLAPQSVALEVRLGSGELRWFGAGWGDSAMSAGCDDPSKPDTSRPHSSNPAPERTFGDYVETLRDGNGMKVQ